MLAYGTDPFKPRPAPPPGKMYTQAQPARQPAPQPAQQQQPAPQPKPKPSGVDMSAYKPGAAQPVQQSYGTAYGQQSSSAQPTAVYWGSQEGQAAAKYAADYHSTYGRLPEGFTSGANPPPPTSEWRQRDFSAEAKNASDHYSRFGELPPETPIYSGGSAAVGRGPIPYGLGTRAEMLARKEARDAGSRRTEVYGDPRGAYAGMPPQYRPPAGQMEPAQTPWGPSMDPFADQRALIDRLNQQRADRQINFNQTWDNPNQGWGNDSYGLDFNIARRDAGLGNGSPSMSPDYGQSFVGNYNQQFGGGLRAWNDPSNPRGPNYDPGAAPRVGGGPDLPRSTTYAYPGGGWGHEPSGLMHMGYNADGSLRPGWQIGADGLAERAPVPRTPTQDELSYYDLSQRVGGKQSPNPFFEPAPLPPQPNAPRGAGRVKDDAFVALPYFPGQAQPVQQADQGTPYGLSGAEWQELQGYGNSANLTSEQRSRKNELQARRVEGARQSPQYKRAQSDLLAKRQATEAANSDKAERLRREADFARVRYERANVLGSGRYAIGNVKYDRFGRIVGRERRGQ